MMKKMLGERASETKTEAFRFCCDCAKVVEAMDANCDAAAPAELFANRMPSIIQPEDFTLSRFLSVCENDN